jgi:hypothetical protein
VENLESLSGWFLLSFFLPLVKGFLPLVKERRRRLKGQARKQTERCGVI